MSNPESQLRQRRPAVVPADGTSGSSGDVTEYRTADVNTAEDGSPPEFDGYVALQSHVAFRDRIAPTKKVAGAQSAGRATVNACYGHNAAIAPRPALGIIRSSASRGRSA